MTDYPWMQILHSGARSLGIAAVKIGFIGLLMLTSAANVNNARASMPIPFFRNVEAILIEVRADPFGQTVFDEAKVAQSARDMVKTSLRNSGMQIGVRIAGPNEAGILAPKTLTVLIHVSVRDTSLSLGAVHPALLATAITLFRGDLKTPEVFPPFFAAAPEPIVATLNKQETEHRLEKAIGHQLQAAVIKPLLDSYGLRK